MHIFKFYNLLYLTALIIMISIVGFPTFLMAQSDNLPDLIVSDITWTPYSKYAYIEFQISVTIANIGSEWSDNALLLLEIGEEQLRANVPSIAAGGKTKIFFNVTLKMPDRYTVRATIDANGELAELDEYNNTKEVTLIVSSLFDYKVERITLSPTSPDKGELTVIKATITNNGKGAAPQTTAEIRIGSTSYYVSIPRLLGGQSTVIEKTHVFTSSGRNTITVIADNENAYNESNEYNNDMSITIRVTEKRK
ncbi:MAG: hypothetical protein JW737_02340 [Acidobacteria bacterium]|nr:hypothetical protein [Acidobacteriota bacterium]